MNLLILINVFNVLNVQPKREVLYKQNGDAVEYFDGAGKALGIIFLHFDTVEEMEEFCEKHNSLIRVILQ